MASVPRQRTFNGAVAERLRRVRTKRGIFSSRGRLGSCCGEAAGKKKTFESFSICDLLSKCVSRALPVCTCRRSQCLKLQPLDSATIPHVYCLSLPLPLSLTPHTPSVLFVSHLCHMNVIADKRKLMHAEAHTHTHTLLSLSHKHAASWGRADG